MQNLLSEIKAVIEYSAKNRDLFNESVKQLHKQTGEEMPSPEKVVELGLDGKDYENVTISPISELTKLILGTKKYSIPEEDFATIKQFVEIAESLTFKSMLAELNKQVKTATKEDIEKLKERRVLHYLNNGQKPRSSFKDSALYDKIAKQKETE